MALITETGTGNVYAESYCSVEQANTHHTNFGNSDWNALSTVAKEIALRKATKYMLQTYRERWAGYRLTAGQALDWPRTEVVRRDAPTTYGSSNGFMLTYYPDDSVPNEVVTACAEFALRSLSADLLADLDPVVASESVGPITVSYFPGASRIKKYTAIDRLLQPFLSGSNSLKVVRA